MMSRACLADIVRSLERFIARQSRASLADVASRDRPINGCVHASAHAAARRIMRSMKSVAQLNVFQ